MVSLRRSGGDVLETSDAPQPSSVPVAHSTAAYPRVNLMPEVIAAEARERRAKTVLVGAAAVSLLAVGGLYLGATQDVNSAQERLDTATAQGLVLQNELAKYSDVPKVQNDVVIAQAQAYAAMGGEVRWSFLLNNLALTIPRGTSLTSFVGTVNGVAPAPTAATDTSGAPSDTAFVSALGHPGIGQIAYKGEARKYGDVAAFLDTLAKQKTLLDPFPGEVKRGEEAAQGLTFEATATVTDNALSHRYDPKAGN